MPKLKINGFYSKLLYTGSNNIFRSWTSIELFSQKLGQLATVISTLFKSLYIKCCGAGFVTRYGSGSDGSGSKADVQHRLIFFKCHKM
jgi:hypothetical protein